MDVKDTERDKVSKIGQTRILGSKTGKLRACEGPRGQCEDRNKSFGQFGVEIETLGKGFLNWKPMTPRGTRFLYTFGQTCGPKLKKLEKPKYIIMP